MLKERGEVTVKESWQHRSKSAVEQGHFSSQQVSAALWDVCTQWSGPALRGVQWKVHQPAFIPV